MINVNSHLSEFKTETDVTAVLKYIARRTTLVYHENSGLYHEHLYFGRSPNDSDILLVYKNYQNYKSECKYMLAINKPKKIVEDVSEHTVENIISTILDNIRINKQIRIVCRKNDIEKDFL